MVAHFGHDERLHTFAPGKTQPVISHAKGDCFSVICMVAA